MIQFIQNITQNKIFLAAFLGWLSAQTIKTLIGIIYSILYRYYKRYDIKGQSFLIGVFSNLFWKTGGMPSSHSALSAALTVAIGLEEGFSSNLFIVTFFFSSIVIRDSMGVRLFTGILAKRTNKLIKYHNNIKEIKDASRKIPQLKIVEGHTASEVFVGVALGTFISIALYLF